MAAFIGEPIQGVGGRDARPPKYFQIVYDIVREHGGLCIADEVQTGFGRTGEHYWGFENWGVMPDIVTMAKGIGNGVPLAAVTTRREIAEAITQRLHFNTFGGNPVSMAAGLAALEIIDEDDSGEARASAAISRPASRELQTSHRLIGEVRGMGLMLGVELVRDRETKEPATRRRGGAGTMQRRACWSAKAVFRQHAPHQAANVHHGWRDVDFTLEVLDVALTKLGR